MARPSAKATVANKSLRRRRIFRAAISVGLTLPSFALVGLTGCRSDGTSRTEITSLGPMRWFARSDASDADSALSETPPVPPPIGRAFVPAPAPAPERAEGPFYGVRRMGAETEPEEKPNWSDRVRGFFNDKPEEPDLKPIPSSYEDSLSQRDDESQSTEITLTAGPFDDVLENDPPTLLGRHVEPVAEGEEFEKDSLPQIVPGRFQPEPVEPPAWPYALGKVRKIATQERASTIARAVKKDETSAELMAGPVLPNWNERTAE